jgi:HAMP domain-containing protein
MTSVFPSRRAERFAQLLDEAAGARRHHSWSGTDTDLSGMVTIGQRVSTLPLIVEVDPEFRTGLRASLMARIEREGIGAAAEPEVDTPARRRLSDLLPSGRTRSAIIATIAAGSFGAFGVSAASGDAIPGDALYGVKRSAEQAQLALAGSDVSRGQLNLEFAKKRLAEAGALGSDLGRLDPVHDDMDEGMRGGSKLLTTAAVERGEVAGLQSIQQFAKDQRPIVADLVERLNGPAKGRAGESLQLLDRISTRVGGLQQTVKCPGIDVPVDDIGAVPVACAKAAPQQQNVPAGAAPETTPQPVVPTTAPANGPAASVDGGSANPPSMEGSSNAPAAAPDNGESGDDGMLDSIKKALEGIFG